MKPRLYPLAAASSNNFEDFLDNYFASWTSDRQRADADLLSEAICNDDRGARKQIVEFLVSRGLDPTHVGGANYTSLLHALSPFLSCDSQEDVELLRAVAQVGVRP